MEGLEILETTSGRHKWMLYDDEGVVVAQDPKPNGWATRRDAINSYFRAARIMEDFNRTFAAMRLAREGRGPEARRFA